MLSSGYDEIVPRPGSTSINVTGSGTTQITFFPPYRKNIKKIDIRVWGQCSYNRGDNCYSYLIFGRITSPIDLSCSHDQYFRPYCDAGRNVAITLEPGQPLTISYETSRNMDISVEYEFYVPRSSRVIVFPGNFNWYERFFGESVYCGPSWNGYYRRNIHTLAYVVVVDLWNTTIIIGYTTNGTLRITVDRPIEIAAVYTFDRTVEHLPPPPRPPPPATCGTIYKVNECIGPGGHKMIPSSSSSVVVPCGSSPPDTITRSYIDTSGNCNAYIAPAPGTYSENQVQRCEKNGNTITCSAPPGSTIIRQCR